MAETITLRAYLDEVAALLESESVNEVISHCRYILQHQPHNIETYRLLGKALLQKGHFEGSTELFNEAAEIFQRVLSVLPTDYVAHLGMSEVSQQTGQLDRAIWHMERAYEQQPGNMVLQDALRQLYVARDGEARAPRKIQLTRAALARQYASGRLYDQALIELRTALEKSPDRVDLEILLAETLWDSQHYVEAGEVAGRALKKLPDCLPAQRILAQLWLYYQRPGDAQPYLKQLEALDPYLAAQLLRPDETIPDVIRLQRLDYSAHTAAAFSSSTPDWLSDLDNLGSADLTMSAAMQAPVMPSPDVWPQPSGPDVIDTAAVFGDPAGIVNWTNDQNVNMPELDIAEVFSDLGDKSGTSLPPDWWADPSVPPVSKAAVPESSVPDWFADLEETPDTLGNTGAANGNVLPDLGAFLTDIQGAGQMDDWLEPGDSDDLFPNMDDLTSESGLDGTFGGTSDTVPPQPAFSEMDWLPSGEQGSAGPGLDDRGVNAEFDQPFAAAAAAEEEEEEEEAERAPFDEVPANADWLFMQDDRGIAPDSVSEDDHPQPAPTNDWVTDIGTLLSEMDAASEQADLGGLFEQAAESVGEAQADFDALFGSMEPAAEQALDAAGEFGGDLGGLFEQAEESVGEAQADFDALFGSMEPAEEQALETAGEFGGDLGGLFEQAAESVGEAQADFDALFGSMEPAAEQALDAAGEFGGDLGGLFEQAEESVGEAQADFDALFGSMEPAAEQALDAAEEFGGDLGGLFEQTAESVGDAAVDLGSQPLGTPWGGFDSTEAESELGGLSGAMEQGEADSWPVASEPHGTGIEEFDTLFGGAVSSDDQAEVPSGFTELLQGISEEREEASYSVLPDVSAIAPPGWISSSLSDTAEASDLEEHTHGPIDEGFGDQSLEIEETVGSVTDAESLGNVPAIDLESAGNRIAFEDSGTGPAEGDYSSYSAAQLGWMGQDDTVSFDELPDEVGSDDWLGTFAKSGPAAADQVPGDVWSSMDEQQPDQAFAEQSPGSAAPDQWLSSMPEFHLEAVEDENLSSLGNAIQEQLDHADPYTEITEREAWSDAPAEIQPEDRVPDWQDQPATSLADASSGDDAEEMLYQPYDPFEGGSPDRVPEYQSAGKTGVLQPNEVPSWMAAFSDDQTLVTDEDIEEPVEISLHDLDLGFGDDEQPGDAESTGDTEQELETSAEEPPQEPAWSEEELVEPVEGEMPGWLAAITSAASADLDESLFVVEDSEKPTSERIAPTEPQATATGQIEEPLEWPVSENEVADSGWTEAPSDHQAPTESESVPGWLAQTQDVVQGVLGDESGEDELNALFDELDHVEVVQQPMLGIDDQSGPTDASPELPWLVAEEVRIDQAGETYSTDEIAVDDELDALFDALDQSGPQDLQFAARVPDDESLDFGAADLNQVAEAADLTHTRSDVADESGWQSAADDSLEDEEFESDDFSFNNIVPVWLRAPKEKDTSDAAQSPSNPIQDAPEWLRNALEDDNGITE